MGLDTTHDCWHGPYSSFGDFRRALAEAAGMPPLYEMAGYKNGFRAWDSIPPDVLHKLLNHSDCEDEIEANDCAPLADRMEELLPKIESDYWREKAEDFIAGLRLAASKQEPVEFH